MRPELGVARHRLAIEAEFVGIGAEQHVRHAVFVAADRQRVVVALHPLPAVGAAEAVADRSMLGRGLRMIGVRLVQPTRLRDAQPVLVLAALDRMEQRDLQGQRQLAGQRPVRRRAPEDQAAGKGEQVELARQVGAAHRFRQAGERAEGQEESHRRRRLFLPPHQRCGPGGQTMLAPEADAAEAGHATDAGIGPDLTALEARGAGPLDAPGQDAESLRQQIADRRLGAHRRRGARASSGVRASGGARSGAGGARPGRGGVRSEAGGVRAGQAAAEGQGCGRRQLFAGRAEEAAPERPRRALLAGAAQRPAHPPFVVLRTGQGGRRQNQVTLVRRRAGAGQRLRPEGVRPQLHLADAVGAIAAAQPLQGMEQLARQVDEARPELEGLLVLGDVPAPRIVFGEEHRVARAAVGAAAEARRRHELGVGGDGVRARSPIPGPGW